VTQEELFSTVLNIGTMHDLLVTFEKIANLKKGAKYQHLLVKTYNGSIFSEKAKRPHDKDMELATVGILLKLFDYVKSSFDITKQRYQKTNLLPWALYMLLEYICVRVSDGNKETLFWDAYMQDLLRNRLRNFKRDLKSTKDCAVEIKFRVNKLISFLSDVYGMEY